MGTAKPFCHYHTGKTMVSTCFKCRNSICELDIHKNFYDSNNLCYFCYTEQLQRNSWIGLFVCLILSAWLLLISLGDSQTEGNISVSTELIGIFFMLAGIGIFVFSKNRIKAATVKYLSKQKSSDTLISDKTMPSIVNTALETSLNQANSILNYNDPLIIHSKATTCKSCGQTFNPDEMFCSNCGGRRR